MRRLCFVLALIFAGLGVAVLAGNTEPARRVIYDTAPQTNA